MITFPASTFEARVQRVSAQLIDDDAWQRAIIAAAALPPDADLDDDADVVRALFAMRFCCADFADVLDDVIAIARERRAASARVCPVTGFDCLSCEPDERCVLDLSIGRPS